MNRIFFILLVCLFVAAQAVICQGKSKTDTNQIERIISLGPINTENIYLLGAGEKIVGNTQYCVRPKAAKNTTKVGTVMQFSLEKVISLQPDIIFATGLTNDNQVSRLISLGYRVERFDQPKSLADSCNQLLHMGKILGLEEKARSIIDQVWQKVATIKRQVLPLEKQRVFLQIGTQPLYGAAIDSFTNDYIELAGGENVLGSKPNGKTRLERIISEDPDVIIIAIMGSETGVAGKVKKNWQRIPSLKAVQNNRIHIIDPDIACSPSPATFVEALEIISKFIHPNV